MKRIFPLFILVVILTPLCSLYVEASLEEGDVLHYKVISSKFSAQYGSNAISTRKFNFNNQTYSARTKIDVTVNFFSSGFNGNYSIGENQDKRGYTDWMLEAVLTAYIYYSSLFITNMLIAWELVDFEDGFPLILYPYVEPVSSSWEYLESLGGSIVDSFHLYQDAGQPVSADYIFKDKDTRIYFESRTKGTTTNEVQANNPHYLPANFSFDNHFQVSYDKTTGVLLGMHMRGVTKGYVNDQFAKVMLNYQIEKTAYSLPIFTLSKRYIVLLILVPVGSIGLIAGSAVLVISIIRKKR